MYLNLLECFHIELAYGGHENDSSGIFQMRPRVGVPGIKLRYSFTIL